MTRSKTAATWLAVLGGTLGLHRFYLHGWRDPVGWLFPLPTLAGVYGALRMSQFGVDDQLSWFLVPVLGLAISTAMLTAIVYGLTPDAKWAARRHQPEVATGWGPILGVIAALLIGGTVLMGTIAFSVQKLVERSFAGPTATAPAGSRTTG